MRMNRGTIILIAALLVIIVVVLVVNNQQASVPTATPTVQEATGPLLAGLDQTKIVRYEVRDNVSGTFTALTKDSGGAWHIDATNTLPLRDPDQNLISTTVGQIASINYYNTFTDTQLATFGLDNPAYSVLVFTSDNVLYTIFIGSKSPTSARYYAVVQQSSAPAATAEATAEATSAPASKLIFQSTAEVTPEATAMATAEATAMPTAEATAEATTMSTAEATAAVTAEATANVVQNPGVTLTGQQTIYVVPQTVIDTLKNWLTTAPYAALPTAVPTLPAPATIPVPATAEVTAAPTVEATTAATAEATATAEVTTAP